MFIDYWETDAGNSPIIEFMESINAKGRTRIQWVIDYFETKGYSLLGTPWFKKLNGGLYELKIQTYRILLIIKKSTACLLHAFVKKSQKTLPKEIKIALARKTILETRLNLAVC